jgi:hypothetical protein
MAALVFPLALLTSGCGGSSTSPAGSSTPVATPAPILWFTDGITEAPVTPQSVTPVGPKVGDSLTAALDGYMTREQKWTGQRIALWPLPYRREQQQAYQNLVYDGSGPRPLLKWGGMSYSVVIAPLAPKWADKEQEIKDRLSGVFADVAAAGGPVFSWASAGISSGNLTVRVDPADECLQPDYAACTEWWQDGSTITRAELIFPSLTTP